MDDKIILTQQEVKNFLNDVRDFGSIEFSSIEELVERAKNRGIILHNNEDLGAIKLLYCPADKANKNRVRIPKEFLKKSAQTLIGKPLDIDHNRRYVIGHFIDAEFDDTANSLIAYAVVYKSNFPEEWEQMKELFRRGILSHSFEVWCPIDKKESLPDGTYNLLEPTLAGGAILFRERPAHPESKILELARQKMLLSSIPDKLSHCLNCNKCTGLCKSEFIGADLVTAPQFIDILSDPKILKKLSDKELLMEHLRCHQIWNTENGKTVKVLLTHTLVVLEMYRRKMKINKVDNLDEKTFDLLSEKIKIFSLYKNLPEIIPLKDGLIKFVGSVLYKENPHDVDVICNDDELIKVIKEHLDDEIHQLKGTVQHGNFWDAYELCLKKKDIKLENEHEPNYYLKYKTCQVKTSLDYSSDMYVIEPLCDKYEIFVDSDNKIICELGEFKGQKVVTDFLAYNEDNFFNEILANRLYFMHKKWLANSKEFIPIYRYIVTKQNLFKALKEISTKFDKVSVRPMNSKYYDGRTLIDFKFLGISAIQELKPGVKFTPLKAKGGAYHELEYFDPEEAWNFFGNHFVKEEGKFKAESKIDGWRCIMQIDKEGKPLIYFEDSKDDVSKNLPNLVESLKKINKNGIILDSELMESEDEVHWTSRQDLATFTSKNPNRSDKYVKAFVFDVLYYNGEDLHNKPLSERWELLKQIANKFDEHLILVPTWDITSKDQLVKLYNRFKSEIKDEYNHNLYFGNGIDGLMLKSYSSDYPLNGRTLAWLKLKYQVEINAIVLEKEKNKAGANLYKVGYLIPAEDKDKYTPVKELNGKYYGILGKTFATKISVEIGEVLGLGMTEIKKTLEDGKIKYTLFQCRVLHERKDLKEPDDVKIVDKLCIDLTNSYEIIFNTTEKIFYVIHTSKVETGNWTIEEGMHGKGCLQLHIRGITEDQKKLVKIDEWKKIGFNPDYFRNVDVDELNRIYKADWKKAIKQAITEESKLLQKYIDEIYKTVDLNEDQKRLIALVDPVSVHTDMRLVPDGATYFEGGHFPQPTNQYHDYDLLKLKNNVHLLFMIKEPHVDEPVRVKEPVVRGDSSWIDVGFPPVWSQPGGVGATTDKWALFIGIDKFEWYAGIQVSPHGKHFKEFYIKGSKIFPEGRLLFMYAPVGGERKWFCYYPKDQNFKSEYLRKLFKK